MESMAIEERQGHSDGLPRKSMRKRQEKMDDAPKQEESVPDKKDKDQQPAVKVKVS